jgi:Rieske Fe-S protein
MYCAGDVVHPPSAVGLNVYDVRFDATSNVATIDLTNRISIASANPCTGGMATLPPIMNNKVVVPFSMYPELMTPGNQVIGVPMGAAINPILIARVDAMSAIAVAALCTHMGCPVAFTPAAKDLECPCHGSTFALSGQVTMGPATRPLTSFVTALDANGITVTIPPM